MPLPFSWEDMNRDIEGAANQIVEMVNRYSAEYTFRNGAEGTYQVSVPPDNGSLANIRDYTAGILTISASNYTLLNRMEKHLYNISYSLEKISIHLEGSSQ